MLTIDGPEVERLVRIAIHKKARTYADMRTIVEEFITRPNLHVVRDGWNSYDDETKRLFLSRILANANMLIQSRADSKK